MRYHKNDIHVFNEYHAVYKAVKTAIQRLIPTKCCKSLASHLIRFSKITSLTIPTHLITDYIELDDDTIQDIDENMKTPINGETLFEEFVEQIEWNKETVAIHNPYTPKQIVLMATDNIKKSCLYIEESREYDKKTSTEKIWANFKVHFAHAFKETRKSTKNKPSKRFCRKCWSG